MIRYNVKARLAKDLGTDEFTLEEFEKEFCNDSPIQSRKEAYDYYTSVIDIIGEGENDIDTISKHIRNKGGSKSIKSGTNTIKIPSNTENLGIGIYLISDKNEGTFKKDQEYLIIGYNESINYLTIARNLEEEISIYKKQKWETQDWTIDIKYYNYQFDEGDEYIIEPNVLYTPFDFWEHHNPTLAEDDFPTKTESIIEYHSVLHEIIKQGENRNLEFKTTLRYCIKKKLPQDFIEKSILKTITAFANTGGGILLIGVNDEGKVVGLNDDYKTLKNKDKFALHFDNLLKSSFTEPIDALLSFGFEEINSCEIFMVTVEASSKPRFLKYKNEGKEFYIRRAASSHSLDLEESYQYIIDKWHA
ncbi:helix-turn-helix domain-containing protein [Maribacter sp. MAR_2009_72]|uniref:AlbA family DNA-binding domain-containing protein n=1 Tax=Maribacter sp. MAR_2009_72 TaxID=1250050 RepID=UPI001199AC3C|nr:ATP-binding protein [Maribacter sp. MAR_2009_72]TVZ13949.1 putative DNA-binding protein [Maribacter sp. MAR_2009_72]